MNKILSLFFLIPLISFGQNKTIANPEYPNNVGDIEFNSKTDKKDFELCNKNHIYQYFNNSGGLEYEGEKLEIEKVFKENYKSEKIKEPIHIMTNCDFYLYIYFRLKSSLYGKIKLQCIT